MISVCVATYNGAAYIEAQLRSILPQLGAKDEVIVSDDGSTDETLGLIQRLGDPRIRVIHHKEPIGSTANFYSALSQAKGDIIFLSDQDDVWLDDKVALCMKCLKDCDLVVSDATVVDADLKPLYPSLFALVHSREGLWRNWLFCTFYGSAMAFRRSVWEQAQPVPKDSLIAHDWWIGMVAEMTGRVRFVNEPMYLYRRHNKTVTTVNDQSVWTRSPRPWTQKIGARLSMLYHIIKYRITHKRNG